MGERASEKKGARAREGPGPGRDQMSGSVGISEAIDEFHYDACTWSAPLLYFKNRVIQFDSTEAKNRTISEK